MSFKKFMYALPKVTFYTTAAVNEIWIDLDVTCVTLGKSLSLSEPPFFHLEYWDHVNTYFIESSRG